MLELLRDYIGEVTASHWSDINLTRRLNVQQRKINMVLGMTMSNWMVKSTDLTPVASRVSLPSDCSRPIYLEETTSGIPIRWLRDLKLQSLGKHNGTNLVFSYASLQAYLESTEIVFNSDSYTTGVTLWYQAKPKDLISGMASAGGSTSLTLPDNALTILVDDYYNGQTFEVVDGTGAGTVTTISDYVASTRVLTLAAGTFGADSVFGNVCELPEEAQDLIVLNAAISALAKPSSTIDEKIWSYIVDERRQANKDFQEWIETRIVGDAEIGIREPGL